ncbi:hypothetical protein J437_LFUL012933 [Ladona fulva]|uniref:Uncharacterized protein n=1 Tax=Ladona fulva TaxID=123851 RepID=A0A8K0P7F1_LADFU|nr:hypothetical protein J437_LFUL012933 [Ladona fulva]
MSQMRSKSLVHFPKMKKMTNVCNFEPLRFTGHLKTLLNQFEKRFQDFSCLEPVVSFCANPFTTKQLKPPQQLQELFPQKWKTSNWKSSLKNIILQAYATDVDFWKLVEKDRFPLFRSVACKTNLVLGLPTSSKNRSRLTDSHLDSCLCAGTSAYVPNIQVLVDEIVSKIALSAMP